jgi:hypothetical protein
MARSAGQPAVSEIVERSTRRVADALAALQPAEAAASQLTEVALHGYVAFAEAVLDRARAAGIARPEIRRILGRMLVAVVGAE